MPEDEDRDDRPPNEAGGAAAWVRRDVESGVGSWFSPLAGFAGREEFGSAPMTNESFTSVVWEYAGRHTAVFQGIQPTGREVMIRGVTVVDHTGPAPRFHRYVDWLDLMGQLGVSAAMRPAVDALDRAAGGQR